MGAARLRILDEADIEAIDRAARIVLYHTGVDVHSKPARDVLASMGARTSPDSPRVLLSERAIDRALDAAPSEVLLASRDGKHDLRLPDGRPHVTTDGCGVNVLDLDTGQRRPSTSKDLVDLTRVADALDSVDVVWPMVVAGDVPGEDHVLAETALSFENTAKNVEHEATSEDHAQRLVEMASAIAGDAEALRKRPVLSSVQCPVSPLTLEAGATDALMVFARAGVPVVPISMILLGGSGPVDLAGSLVIANAENLASLCVSQGTAPGAPLIYSVSTGPIDMRTGSFAAGSPEAAVASVVGVELARHYGLPCLVGGLSADADSPGYQAAAEKVGAGLPPMLAGADLIAGVGSLETDSTLSVEQLVLDDDLVSYGRKVAEPLRVDDETIHLDLISRVGPAGNFLKEMDTLKHFRQLWSPRMLLRDGFVEGSTAEARLRARAQARAKELLRTHKPPPLDPEVRKAMWSAAGLPPP